MPLSNQRAIFIRRCPRWMPWMNPTGCAVPTRCSANRWQNFKHQGGRREPLPCKPFPLSAAWLSAPASNRGKPVAKDSALPNSPAMKITQNTWLKSYRSRRFAQAKSRPTWPRCAKKARSPNSRATCARTARKCLGNWPMPTRWGPRSLPKKAPTSRPVSPYVPRCSSSRRSTCHKSC
ncbi:hypothetical protein D3C85_1031100 [compost metagenome]